MRTKPLISGFVLLSLTVGAAFPLAHGQTASAFPFTLPSSSAATCWFSGAAFQATEGQAITFQWSENLNSTGPISMDFYIVPANAFRLHWLCIQGPSYVYWNDGAYGIAKWAAPSTGSYAAILVNSAYYAVSGTLTLTTPNATISASPLALSTVPKPWYATGGSKG